MVGKGEYTGNLVIASTSNISIDNTGKTFTTENRNSIHYKNSSNNNNDPPTTIKIKKKRKKARNILKIGTLNVRTLNKLENLLVLESAFQETDIKILGLAEVRRAQERIINTKAGNIFYRTRRSWFPHKCPTQRLSRRN